MRRNSKIAKEVSNTRPFSPEEIHRCLEMIDDRAWPSLKFAFACENKIGVMKAFCDIASQRSITLAESIHEVLPNMPLVDGNGRYSEAKELYQIIHNFNLAIIDLKKSFAKAIPMLKKLGF